MFAILLQDVQHFQGNLTGSDLIDDSPRA